MHIGESKHVYGNTGMGIDTYVPGWRATMRLSKSEVSAQLKNNFKHVIRQNRNNHAWQLNQSVIKSHMLGSHQYPFILHGPNP